MDELNYLNNIMYMWLTEEKYESVTEHVSNFNFAQFVRDLMKYF